MKNSANLCFIIPLLFISFTKVNAQGIELLLQTGHSKPITSLATSADGNYFITGSYDNTAKVWDITTGNVIKVLEGHSAAVNSASFSNDGMYIITSSADKTIKIWEFVKNPDNKIIDKKYEYAQSMALRYDVMSSGTVKDKLEDDLSRNSGCLQTYAGHKSSVNSVSIDGSLKNFISSSKDDVKFWDPLLVKEEKSIPLSEVNFSGFTPDGKKYFTVENNKTINLWKFPSASKILSISSPSDVKKVVASQDKKYLSSLDASNTIHVYDIEKGNELFNLSNAGPMAFEKAKAVIIYASNNEIIVHDVAGNKSIRKIPLAGHKVNHLSLSGDGKFIIAVANDKDILILDYSTGKIKEYKPGMNEDFDITIISNNWENVLSVSQKQSYIQNTEVLTGKTTICKTAIVDKAIFSPDNKIVATLDQNKTISIYGIESLAKLTDFNIGNEKVSSISFSKDSENLLVLQADGTLQFWSWKDKKKLSATKVFPEDAEVISSRFLKNEVITYLDSKSRIHFLQTDGTEILGINNSGTSAGSYNETTGQFAIANTVGNIEIWSLSKKVKIKDVGTGLKGPVEEIELSADGKFVSAMFPSGRIKVFEVATAYEMGKRIVGKRLSKLNSLSFSPNDKYIMCVNQSNTIVLWSWKEDKEIRMINGKNGSIIVASDNNYIVSNKGIDLISFKKGDQYYTFEQFDLHYNRPDKVMQQLGYVSEDKIKICRLAYNKRLKKLGFINSLQGIGVHIPKTSVENNAEIPATTSAEKITLKIKATDTDYLLRSINVVVNGVPVHGIKGLQISDKKSKEYEGTVEITLSKGENKIKVFCMNEKGAESYKQSLTVICDKAFTKPDLYLTVIGVSEYKNASMNLRYAAKDGQDITNLLKQEKNNYQNIYLDTIFNQKATLATILATKQKLAKSKVDDKVILFIAGHGLLDANLDYYLATYDVDFANPATNGLPYEKMEDLLDGIPARNKLLIMDACHSGEVDKEEVKFTTTPTETKKEEVIFRAVPNSGVKKIGLDNSFEMMKQLFADLRKGNGTTVISSAGGAEYAMEGAEWKNGVFTYSFISGVREMKADLNGDGKIMLSEIQQYLQIKVPEITQGRQKPTSRAENISNDWQLK